MRKHFSHCLLCGRVIPEGNVYCELCRRNAESNPLDPDRELVKNGKRGPSPHRRILPLPQRKKRRIQMHLRRVQKADGRSVL